ncbi:Ankyrin-3 like protein [Argiope bruennichi]|uniref:Alpha-latrotoxin n=1 Tax=Argiope bruennichi TaxID=94029 RepID=A0A8T0ENC5_ARGBR|nr:Ankyrin-3 like protein [Argiope bruennichi]
MGFRCDINLQKALKCLLSYGRLATVGYLIQESKSSINCIDIYGRTPLHLAAINGHTDVVRCLLNHDAEMAPIDRFGNAALHYAIIHNHLTIASILLEKESGVDANKTFLGDTALHLASGKGHMNLVVYLLDKIPVNFRSDLNFVPLHKAAKGGHTNVVELLITAGAKINAKSLKGTTPLHLAAEKGHYAVALKLLQHGADINITDLNGSTPLSFSIREGFLAVSELLLGKDIVIDSFRSSYECPLNLAAYFGHHELLKLMLYRCDTDFKISSLYLSAYMGHLTSVKFLIKKGVSIKYNATGCTALHFAACGGHTDIANFLISRGYDVNAKITSKEVERNMSTAIISPCCLKACDINARSRQKNETALYLAVFNDHPGVASYLMNCDASACHDCAASLEIAVKRNRMDIVNMLMNKNVDISKEKEREYLLSAIRDGNDDIAEYFLKRNPETALSRPECHEFPLHSAVESGHLNIVKKLLELEIRNDINEKNNESATPLELASVEGYCEIVRVLLEKGADPNHAPGRSEPLHMAVLSGYSEIIEILYNAGANLVNIEGCSAIELAVKIKNLDAMEKLLELSKFDINIEGHSGCTLLHNAAASGSLEIVKSLVEKGATINCRDSTNAKPIHIAAKEGHKSIVEYFLSVGVEIDSRGENGWSLLHYAAAGNQSDICKVLFKNGLSINIIDDNGCSALHVAAQMGQIDVLHTLLHFGAYYDFRNERNETPYDVAKSSDLHNIHVIASFIFISNLFSAVQKNNLPHVEALLNEGFEFSEFGYANIKNSKNLSLLHFAAWKGYEGIVNLLLKHNADPNAKTANGCTPLHYAAKFSYPKVARALLRSGAIFNAESNGKKTPLDFANDGDIIELLNILNAIFSKIENNEYFISDNLIPLKNLDIVKTVMRAKNSCGKTLTAFAIIKEHPEAQSLKSLFQPDVTFHCQRADRLCKEGQFHESLEQYKVILEKRIDMFSDKDPGVLDIQEIISEILIKQERYDQAQSLIEKNFRIRKEILGDFHKDTLKTMRLMALILGRKGRKREALNIYEDVLKKQQHLLGSSNEETLLTQIHIAQLNA